MISIGVAQIANTLAVDNNFKTIFDFLGKFKSEGVDLIVFPECGLSGFSAKMKDCTVNYLRPYVEQIQQWSSLSDIQVILPTAVVDENKIYNSGFWFNGKSRTQFYKLGLTDSEKKFFTTPEHETQKVFKIKNFRCGLLICKEAQEEPWRYIAQGEVDFLIWPGYWGWTTNCKWQAVTDEKRNLVFENSLIWKAPLIQANFAYNDFGGTPVAGPEGLSMVVDSDNALFFQGDHRRESGFIVQLENRQNKTVVKSCKSLETP
ncbi:MAG: carbon-nitrogen hydrolase family protein [Bdellovibrio sp.]